MEIISKRTENNKLFSTGKRKFKLIASVAPVHYKDNYTNENEQWKDIDLTIVNNKITKAPYELTIKGNKYTFRNKKTGEISTIEKVSAAPVMEVKAIPTNTGFKLQHVIDADKLPFQVIFRISGRPPDVRAFDDIGELKVDVNIVGGVLTERIIDIRDKKTNTPRDSVGNIRIDPTYQVSQSQDDILVRYISPPTSDWNALLAGGANQVGCATTNFYKSGCGLRFPNVTIPSGSTIDAAKLTLEAQASLSDTTVNSVIIGEDVDNASVFSDLADYQARRGTIVGGANDDYITSASVTWNNIGAWTINTDYDSPEIKTIIQEIIDRGGWSSGNAMVIFWDDHAGNSDYQDNHYRSAESYDGDFSNAPILDVTYTAPISPARGAWFGVHHW